MLPPPPSCDACGPPVWWFWWALLLLACGVCECMWCMCTGVCPPSAAGLPLRPSGVAHGTPAVVLVLGLGCGFQFLAFSCQGGRATPCSDEIQRSQDVTSGRGLLLQASPGSAGCHPVLGRTPPLGVGVGGGLSCSCLSCSCVCPERHCVPEVWGRISLLCSWVGISLPITGTLGAIGQGSQFSWVWTTASPLQRVLGGDGGDGSVWLAHQHLEAQVAVEHLDPGKCDQDS